MGAGGRRGLLAYSPRERQRDFLRPYPYGTRFGWIWINGVSTVEVVRKVYPLGSLRRAAAGRRGAQFGDAPRLCAAQGI